MGLVMVSDFEDALKLANKVLEQPRVDPNGNEAVLARQLLRTREKLEALWHFSACPYDHCEKCIRDAPIIKGLRTLLGSPTDACEPEFSDDPSDQDAWYERARILRGEP